MSLLLDALKKAADDKEKKLRDATAPHNEASDVSKSSDVMHEELSLQENIAVENTPDKSVEPLDIGSDEFRLDDIELSSDKAITDDDVDVSTQTEESLELETKKETSNSKRDANKSTYAVSDDALSMLIYKTNRDVKRGKKILFLSLFVVTLFVLISGGVFYYHNLESEIEALERKHKIAMQAMRLKTNKEKTPEKTEIIRNLVSDAALEEKVKNAKQYLEEENKKVLVQKPEIKTENTRVEKPALSIKRTNKTDPVGDMLDDAWLSYEALNYIEANRLYKKVLLLENNNRDALLGIGAIAVIEQDYIVAREAYLKLLNLDPRDPIATAALAGLHSNKSSLASDEKYFLAMLKNNPDAPHLNFALGNVYAQLDKWPAAQQYYFSAWQQDSENADYIFNLAVSMDQLSKQKEAIGFYKECLLKATNKQVSFSREAVQKRINELTRL